MKPADAEICRRIALLRMETEGPRGKSSFAKKLGISPSTYEYYEHSRVPPARVLVRIAEVTGADLQWLLTGKASSARAVAADNPILHRAAALLADRPDAAAPLAAFLDLLAGALAFPDKTAEAGASAAASPDAAAAPPAGKAAAPARADHPAGPEPPDRPEPPDAPASGREGWIPILGRTAAGVAHFWADGSGLEGLTTLDALIARYASAAPRAVRTAEAASEQSDRPMPVQLVVLAEPGGEGTAEFLVAPAVRARWADAFALRVDGDSMAPEIRHGDVVVLSPRAPAAEGRPAVVQLAGQIGVTCKLYRRSGQVVHLVPINERYDVLTRPAGQVAWALRVLARVRA